MGTFGENLKRIRKSRGLTQAKLAELIGQTQACVSKWETGERSPLLKSSLTRGTVARYESDDIFPRQANLKAIAEALGCTMSELLGEESQEPKRESIEIIVKINGEEVMRWQR